MGDIEGEKGHASFDCIGVRFETKTPLLLRTIGKLRERVWQGLEATIEASDEFARSFPCEAWKAAADVLCSHLPKSADQNTFAAYSAFRAYRRRSSGGRVRWGFGSRPCIQQRPGIYGANGRSARKRFVFRIVIGACDIFR